MSPDPANTKPSQQKTRRATTASRNRADSPPPYRSTDSTSIQDFANEFWQHAMNVAEHHPDDFKHQALPLARIKKVAKMDPELQNQMISSEVTVLFEKACQIFIQELTARAHMRSLASRRRMISRADVAAAVSRSDMFDFLIDIVPRPERSPSPLPGQYASEHQQQPEQETYDAQAEAVYSTGMYGDEGVGVDEPVVASTSTDPGAAAAAAGGYPSRPTRSSTRSRRFSERGSDVEMPPAAATAVGADSADRMHPGEKRQRVEFPGTEHLVGQVVATATTAASGDDTAQGAVPSASATTNRTSSSSAATASLTIPSVVPSSSSSSPHHSGGSGGMGPPHLHPTGLPNPNLGPQPGAAPAPIIDAETLRQAYAAVAGSMPPGLFMPHLMSGSGGGNGTSGSGGEGLTGGPAGGGGAQPIPWPPFAYSGSEGEAANDGIGSFYTQEMDTETEQQHGDLGRNGRQA
ncbi:hypothetical protein JCM3774_001119 [Rhodotorula dairenensis]